MSGERVERRLAAILAADVAGYSRLMGQDEAGTLARLRAHRLGSRNGSICPKAAICTGMKNWLNVKRRSWAVR